MTDTWQEDEKAYYVKKLVSYLGLKDGQGKLWSYMTNKYRGKVRSSCLAFVSQFIKNVPKEITQNHYKQIAPLIFDMISEDHVTIQTILWKESLFNLATAFPEVWQLVSLKKSFTPNLLTCIKNSAYGATHSLY
jgi:hypothetical protein